MNYKRALPVGILIVMLALSIVGVASAGGGGGQSDPFVNVDDDAQCGKAEVEGGYSVEHAYVKAVLFIDGVQVDSDIHDDSAEVKFEGSLALGSHTAEVLGYTWVITEAAHWGDWQTGHGSGSGIQEQHKHGSGSWQDGACSGSNCTEQHRHWTDDVWGWSAPVSSGVKNFEVDACHAYTIQSSQEAICQESASRYVDLYDKGAFVERLYEDSVTFTDQYSTEAGLPAYMYPIPDAYGGGHIDFAALPEPGDCLRYETSVLDQYGVCTYDVGQDITFIVGDGLTLYVDDEELGTGTITQNFSGGDHSWYVVAGEGYDIVGPEKGTFNVDGGCNRPVPPCPTCGPAVDELVNPNSCTVFLKGVTPWMFDRTPWAWTTDMMLRMVCLNDDSALLIGNKVYRTVEAPSEVAGTRILEIYGSAEPNLAHFIWLKATAPDDASQIWANPSEFRYINPDRLYYHGSCCLSPTAASRAAPGVAHMMVGECTETWRDYVIGLWGASVEKNGLVNYQQAVNEADAWSRTLVDPLFPGLHYDQTIPPTPDYIK
jgi:hypothetical protein